MKLSLFSYSLHRNNIAKISILLCTSLLCICSTLKSQPTNFSGIWMLKERKSLSGVDYGNGVPLQLIIKQQGKSISIQITSIDSKGEETVNTESLVVDADSFMTVTSTKRKKIVRLNSLGKGSQFARAVTFSMPEKENEIDIRVSEIWTLNQLGGKVSLVINKSTSSKTPGDVWTMEGIYDKISPQEYQTWYSKGKGIEFINEQDWQFVLKKAKRENKYIFVDCYATWCGPCKKMEKEIYPLNRIGDLMNDKFISIKLQLDSTKNDNEQVRNWYDDASMLQKQYAVNAFPTYLFFNPNGKLVHRGLGFEEASSFIDLVSASLDTSKQYYTRLDNYKKGKKDYSTMRYFASTTKVFDDEKLANTIAEDYKVSYLDKLDIKLLCTKENLSFIEEFPHLSNSSDGYFKLFFQYAKKVDSIMRIGFSERFVFYIINKEDVIPSLYRNTAQSRDPIVLKPNWKALKELVASKYNQHYADILIRAAQLSFFPKVKDGPAYVAVVEEIMKENPPKPDGKNFSKSMGGSASNFGDYFSLNETAWYIYNRFDDKYTLQKALEWIELAHTFAPTDIQILDTKAHLLYKLQRDQEAISVMEAAITIAPNNISAQETLEKMKTGKLKR